MNSRLLEVEYVTDTAPRVSANVLTSPGPSEALEFFFGVLWGVFGVPVSTRTRVRMSCKPRPVEDVRTIPDVLDLDSCCDPLRRVSQAAWKVGPPLERMLLRH